jgi:hypothetical protein
MLTMCHPPHKSGRDKKERASLVSTIKWEGKAKSEIALTMTEQIWWGAHCHCKQCNRIGGLHPSPRSSVGRVARSAGWGSSRGMKQPPTRHIVRNAHAVLPQSELRSSRPHKSGRDKKERASLASTKKWEGKAKSEIALAMTEQTWLRARHRCIQRNRIGGLHPSPVFVGRVARSAGWGSSRGMKQPPTRHIVRNAHDVPPSPQKWEG